MWARLSFSPGAADPMEVRDLGHPGGDTWRVEERRGIRFSPGRKLGDLEIGYVMGTSIGVLRAGEIVNIEGRQTLSCGLARLTARARLPTYSSSGIGGIGGISGSVSLPPFFLSSLFSNLLCVAVAQSAAHDEITYTVPSPGSFVA